MVRARDEGGLVRAEVEHEVDDFDWLGGASGERWLPDAPEADAEAWRASIAAFGFAFPSGNLALMRTQLREANERTDVMEALNRPELRKDWSTKFRETKTSSVEEKMSQLADPRAAELMREAIYASMQEGEES